VAAAEMVPLLPTTPLALVAGLLLGAAPGAAAVLAGNLLAASGAFWVSRGVGARFARAVVAAEGGGGGSGNAPCPLSAPGGLWARVAAAVDAGSPAEKFAAVAALRATPVIPFSLSSYALGLAPPAGLPFSCYIAGTAVGASIWAGVYASLGAASRGALAAACGSGAGGSGGGVSGQEGVLADLLERAAAATEGAAGAAAGVAGAALLAWGAAALLRRGRGGGRSSGGSAPAPPES
jgi:hypothetical protein